LCDVHAEEAGKSEEMDWDEVPWSYI
jgi:hypothetical protein